MRRATNRIDHNPFDAWTRPDMPEIKTKFAVGYVRLSDRAADGTEVSLDRQRDEIGKWCKQNGLTLVAMFEDVGISGRKPVRKGLDSAISECAMRGALLVSFSLDRIARTPEVMDRLKTEKVAFRALDFPEVSELMLDVLMFVGSMYSRMVSNKMVTYHKNRKERAARGETTPHPIPSIRPDRGIVEKNMAKARATRQRNVETLSGYAWDRIKPLAERGLSHRQIAIVLNDAGYLTPRQKPWNHVAVGRVINRYQLVTQN
jgi:DNA invertase Pin-like site-specific DNA recombinase